MAHEATPPAPDALAATVMRIADAVGALMEAWGFKRNMGRLWALLYLDNRPLPAAEIGEKLSLSTGAVSMLLTEMQEWGAIKKTWIPGERREYFEPEASIWKMVSRVFRVRELGWIHTAAESFEEARAQLAAAPPAADGPDGERARLIAARITGLSELARIGAHLLEAILQGESIDVLPIKAMGELARAARGEPER